MNNPFSRLKHYTVSGTDPQARAIEQQENHATECLAACLVFSSRIRKEFIRFVLNDPSKGFDSEEVDVVTQQTIEGGYIDLVLRQKGNLVMAVEVKVKSPENCDHHRNQLQNYKKWLDQQEGEPHHFLFTLVRNGDKRFHPEQYGATARRTWWALYKSFKEMLGTDDSSDVESSLIENFRDYLESEAIVSTYEIKDLLSYSAGLKARRAVTGIFNQITSRLEAEGMNTVVIEDRKDYWPQLRIQHARWKSIFGDGQNRKIALWFCVPGIWEATQHEFWPEIELWHEDHGNDWQFVKSTLPAWLDRLKSRNFKWIVFRTWSGGERDNVPAQEINLEPKKIVARREGDSVILNQSELLSEDALINVLVNRIKDYANIVDSLAS
jgi:hypothetical protein